MNRCLAFLFALMLSTLSVASACTAETSEWLHFRLEAREQRPSEIHATFREAGNRDARGRREKNNWSTNFTAPQLIGLNVASFRAAGTRPLRFALVREAGRLDCGGNGGRGRASGTCRFSSDPNFLQLLRSRGIAAPDCQQAFGLVALDTRRELIDAIAAARYPTPTVDELLAMTALGVNGDYIQGLARVGYRPASIDTLVEFKALNITPEYIGGWVRSGRANMDPDELVKLKALNVTPEFIAGFERIGYRNLSIDTLVELKALDITPEFVRSVQGGDSGSIQVGELMRRKVSGRRQ